MKKGLLKKIGAGILNGFPLVQSVVKTIKSEPSTGEPVKKTDAITLIAEIATVALIIAFIMGKITMEDLMKLLHLL